MSVTPTPKPSLSMSTQNTAINRTSNGPSHAGMLPTPSSSSSAPEVATQHRRELEQQIAEKEKQLQDSRGGIGKSVLARQITQLNERLLELDRREQQQKQAHTPLTIRPSPVSPQQPHPTDESDLSPTTLEKLNKLKRDIRGYQPLSPSSSLSGNGSLRKDKLGTRSSGLDSLPSPSNSTMMPSDSASLLPLPPPPTGSTPTKRRSKVPNADRRNTDIEFATEIGQGLLIEVRKMQALLQEKEDQLKLLQAQKADLERAAESMAKQLRQREENEEKLKEETWNLELAKQELTISVSELQQNLNKANAEQKRMSEQMKRLDADIEAMRDKEQKLSGKLKEMKQQHDHEMANLRRHALGLQREKADSAKQVEALSSELAIAKAQSVLLSGGGAASKRTSMHAGLNKKRNDDITANGLEAEQLNNDEQKEEEKNSSSSSSSASNHVNKENGATTQPSNQTPPPSPKQTSATIARNRELEVESLKTSLAHAHRLVTSLRSNLSREKQEKHEINKFLTEARERIELLENDPRLWVDDYSTGSIKGPDSGGRRRARTKANQKRRVPVSKTRASMLTGEEAEKRRGGSDEEGEEYYDDVDEDGDDEENDDYTAALGGVGTAAASAAGFTSLESELAAKTHRVTSPSNCPRTLGDELSAVDQQQQLKTPPTTTASAGIEAGVQTDDATSYSTTTTAPMTHELGVQTDDSMQLHELVSKPAFEIAPAETHDQETQSDDHVAIDTEAQTDTAVAVDTETQSNGCLGGIDQSTETAVPDVVSESVQTADIVDEDTPSAAGAALGEGTAINNGTPARDVDDEGERRITKNHAGTDSSYADMDSNRRDSKIYSQADMEAMIATAVAGALAAATKKEQRVNDNAIPPRPSSPPPAYLVSRVSQQMDKGKAPLVRPPSRASSTSRSAGSEHRVSIGSFASLQNNGHIGTVTQTMIGDWLWKYTHKPFSDGHSDNRHRRYFWVHPYTRTIYWSTKRPGSQGSKTKTKSALIEGVSAVEDHNPLPAPDVPAVSILVKTSDGQTIKMTAPTLARHQVWFESLQYLMTRGESDNGSGVGDEKKAATVAERPQQKQQSSSVSSSNATEKRPSINRFLRAFEQSSSSGRDHHSHDHQHEDISDELMVDVRSCCDGKHHVSKLERDHINQRPFYRKRTSQQIQRSGGSAACTSTCAPPTAAQPRQINLNA